MMTNRGEFVTQVSILYAKKVLISTIDNVATTRKGMSDFGARGVATQLCGGSTAGATTKGWGFVVLLLREETEIEGLQKVQWLSF